MNVNLDEMDFGNIGGDAFQQRLSAEVERIVEEMQGDDVALGKDSDVKAQVTIVLDLKYLADTHTFDVVASVKSKRPALKSGVQVAHAVAGKLVVQGAFTPDPLFPADSKSTH